MAMNVPPKFSTDRSNFSMTLGSGSNSQLLVSNSIWREVSTIGMRKQTDKTNVIRVLTTKDVVTRVQI